MKSQIEKSSFTYSFRFCCGAVRLGFLEPPSAELAVPRVADRVQQGGHHIPEAVIRWRFASGKTNFHHVYKPLADVWRHYENAGQAPVLRGWAGLRDARAYAGAVLPTEDSRLTLRVSLLSSAGSDG